MKNHAAKLFDLVRDQYNQFLLNEESEEGEYRLILTISEAEIKSIQDYALQQNLTTIRNRVNELGVAEPLVQRQGADRIIVELPGVQDTAAAKRVLGATANLEFRLEARQDAPAATTETYQSVTTPIAKLAWSGMSSSPATTSPMPSRHLMRTASPR